VRFLVLLIAASLAFAGPVAAKSKHCDRHSAKAQKACERQQARKRRPHESGMSRSEEEALDRASTRNILLGIQDRVGRP
jgi:hypothetical protein